MLADGEMGMKTEIPSALLYIVTFEAAAQKKGEEEDWEENEEGESERAEAEEKENDWVGERER